ncbi:2,3,4,5-tetrahydropyridine-2,6-carboxylate N-succinyltransferase [Rhodobacterales bacterium 59_46_T64]|nr:2,3,4,5-tetrahydropyridine-2,6-carboxylate N-succinyltransferase [Rhodobacterales bacterium 59_46_T64]
MVAASKLSVNSNASALQMAQEIFGPGVQVVGASVSGDSRSSGVFEGGDTVAPGLTPADTGVILSTGRADSVTNPAGTVGKGWNTRPADANQSDFRSTNTRGLDNEADFNEAAGTRTFDAAYIDVDFIPDGDVMTMQFVFSSEEYPEFTTGQYQDFVGVWVNGQQVELAVGDGDIDPGNINGSANQNLYVDNANSEFNTEMDGFTVTMTLTMPVNAGALNSIRIGIADVTDTSYDSNLLIAGGSVQTAVVAHEDVGNVFAEGSTTIDVLANDYNVSGGQLFITQINGTDVYPGQVITLKTGQQVFLNTRGTLTVIADEDVEDVSFTYTIQSEAGQTDVGFVTVSSIPCFVAGTMIRTPDGDVAVESLEPGDLVMTKDDGAQPLRWIGRRGVAATGDFAPIRIDANTFGRHDALFLSPLHRVLIRDHLAELMFGEAEVLVAAKDLVNDCSVRRIEGGAVEYVHLLFDRHQVVYSAGLETESFLPGPQTNKSFEAEIVREICAIFPEIDPETGAGYSPAARRLLRGFEARLLFGERSAA